MKSLEVGETLVVAQLNRLGRTQSEVVARLAELSDGGIYVETLDGLLNTAALGRMAPLVIGLLTGTVEVERSLIQERTRASVDHRRRIGGNIGGRPCLADGRRELVRRLTDRRKSHRDVAAACDFPGHGTLVWERKARENWDVLGGRGSDGSRPAVKLPPITALTCQARQHSPYQAR